MQLIAGNRAFPALATAVLLLGTADSMVGAYLVLFAADGARLTPVQVGLLTSATAAGGMVVNLLAARRFDRAPTRAYAAGAAALGALGYFLLPRTSTFPLLLLIAGTLLAAVAAAFPQLFALARVVLGAGSAGRRAAPLLRSGWSLAWAIGPLAGAAVLAVAGFAGTFCVAAAVLALTALVVLTVPAPGSPVPETTPEHRPAGSSAAPVAVGPLVTAVALFYLAVFAGSVALPLHVTRGLHLPASAVGLLYSVCAAVEVVAALVLARLPARIRDRGLIVAAMGSFAAFCVLAVLADGMVLLLASQVARGVAIAGVGASGIRFFQDVLAPAAGRAMALYSNANAAGALLAGVLAGMAVQYWGSPGTLLACGGAAVAGAVTFVLGTSPGRPGVRR
ncbi:SET family sugar efflux transporter-like MFS transporter [Pseudonocardia hierapolitana]|uniref:SET family sugar efflux transporter-like MFS transporter n=1 Tax=Pseudonocardia hierapolitana TaxID=1128676 RepID=A0A561SLV6_9PSEU|nr:MFS transporter [Pseudonocardia hierapolitana]TWF75849.1 SET family sugar efflux transporter-like MFS transporter [Pseudonocardia hierapolitana]